MEYKTAAQVAKDIRAALKSLGYNSKMVSVRSREYSMGASIGVTIKDKAVDADKVRHIAKAFEQVDRDASGDILSGGNLFVSVDDDIFKVPCALCGIITAGTHKGQPVCTCCRGYDDLDKLLAEKAAGDDWQIVELRAI